MPSSAPLPLPRPASKLRIQVQPGSITYSLRSFTCAEPLRGAEPVSLTANSVLCSFLARASVEEFTSAAAFSMSNPAPNFAALSAQSFLHHIPDVARSQCEGLKVIRQQPGQLIIENS